VLRFARAGDRRQLMQRALQAVAGLDSALLKRTY
jgi:hypothetical protein